MSKPWLFQKGGRPVIYQAHEEYDQLSDAQKFLHVRYEPHRNVDHTWEREWRVQTDSLTLEPSETTFVVPTRAWERRFHQEHIEDVATTSFLLEIPIDDPMPWHFVVLEGLGVEGFDEYAF